MAVRQSVVELTREQTTAVGGGGLETAGKPSSLDVLERDAFIVPIIYGGPFA